MSKRKIPLRRSLPNVVRTLRYFWPIIRRRRALMAGSFAAMLFGVVLRALEPWPVKIVFDSIFAPEAAGDQPLADRPLLLLGVCAAALVVILALRALTTYWHKVGFALVGNKVLTEIRGRLYAHLQCLSLSFHNRARRGDLIVRVTGDIGQLKQVTTTALMPLLASVLIIVFMASLMLWVNWSLALVALATLPLSAVSGSRLGRKISRASRDQRKREGAMATTAAESMNAIHVVKTLTLEDTFSESFAGQNKKSLKEGVQIRRLAARLQGTVQVLSGVSTAAVLFYGSVLVMRASLTPGELLVFLSYVKAMFKPIQDFAKYAGRVAKASAASDRIMDLFEQEPEVTDAPDAIEAPALSGYVEFRDVSFSYGDENDVLEKIDLRIARGERVALIGASGHGKSTIASLLMRLYDPTEGAVRLDGVDLRRYKVASIRRQVSVVLQESVLFATTIRENIGYGDLTASDADIERAARLANAHEFIMRLPAGYNTVVGERGVTLSAGQRQRIAIARAAIRKTPILILDEPTTGLDAEAENTVVDALERVGRDRTVILITHNMRHAATADRIVYIDRGRICETGTHEELMRGGGAYAAMYRAHAGHARRTQRMVA